MSYKLQDAVSRLSHLRGATKSVLLTLARCSKNDDHPTHPCQCWLSVARIASESGYSVRSTNYALRSLVDANLVKIDYRAYVYGTQGLGGPQSTNLYTLTLDNASKGPAIACSTSVDKGTATGGSKVLQPIAPKVLQPVAPNSVIIKSVIKNSKGESARARAKNPLPLGSSNPVEDPDCDALVARLNIGHERVMGVPGSVQITSDGDHQRGKALVSWAKSVGDDWLKIAAKAWQQYLLFCQEKKKPAEFRWFADNPATYFSMNRSKNIVNMPLVGEKPT